MKMRRQYRSVEGFASLLWLGASLQGFAQPGPGGPPRVESPEVLPDGRVTFSLLAPEAREVRLVGSDIPGLAPDTRLVRAENGVWSVTIGPITPPGAYRYTFRVDELAVVDPTNPSASESNQQVWSLVNVPGLPFLDARDVPHGAVSELAYYSKSLGRHRRMHVYTPPGYQAGGGSYPVLYLLHGASDSDDSWTSVGRAGFILDNLIAENKAVPMIVVMPNGHTDRFYWGSPRFAADAFLDDFRNDVLPCIEKTFRVRTERASRAVAGLSMGGWQALNIAIPDLDQYAYLGIFSSGIFGLNQPGPQPDEPSWEEQHRTRLDDPALKNGLRLLWIATGRDDFLLDTSRATADLLRKHGFAVTYQETDGGHTWINWRQYLNDFAPLLFQQKGVSH